jgi:Subtilase family/Proprotein convertase P-domain
MRLLLVLAVFCWAFCSAERWVVELAPNTDPRSFAADQGLRYRGQLKHLKGRFFEFSSNPARSTSQNIAQHHAVVWAEKQIPRKQYKRQASDPLYPSQWHLHGNTAVSVQAEWAWQRGKKGAGVTIAVIDDGLQREHPDLKDRFDATHSWDYNGHRADPRPTTKDAHGTSAAGVAGASQNNGHCGSGVAPEVKLVGIRAIAAPITDHTESQALSRYRNLVNIYSCSWGPIDDAKDLRGPGRLTHLALQYGVINGRSGKGNIFVWAAGNGRVAGDSCNYDGYSNSPFTFSIGAINNRGTQSWYSEGCAGLLAVAPSSGQGIGITTTDLMGKYGYASGECTNQFGGTSSAAPLAAGVIALILQDRPELTWRDVLHVIAKGATPVDLDGWVTTGGEWHTNQRGYKHSQKYGFGNMVVPKLMQTSHGHKLVPTMKTHVTPTRHFTPHIGALPNVAGMYLDVLIDVSASPVANFLEQVLVTIEAHHGRRGEVAVILISPHGDHAQSVLSTYHMDTHNEFPTGGWTFSTLRHWGEPSANGQWKVRVYDSATSNPYTGYLKSVKLTFMGF